MRIFSGLHPLDLTTRSFILLPRFIRSRLSPPLLAPSLYYSLRALPELLILFVRLRALAYTVFFLTYFLMILLLYSRIRKARAGDKRHCCLL
jgi:hypothetical protein